MGARYYRRERMKIWVNNKFEGHWPVGTAAVVIAETEKDAAEYLSLFLRESGLPDAEPEDMELMPFEDGEVRILADGNY